MSNLIMHEWPQISMSKSLYSINTTGKERVDKTKIRLKVQQKRQAGCHPPIHIQVRPT